MTFIAYKSSHFPQFSNNFLKHNIWRGKKVNLLHILAKIIPQKNFSYSKVPNFKNNRLTLWFNFPFPFHNRVPFENHHLVCFVLSSPCNTWQNPAERTKLHESLDNYKFQTELLHIEKERFPNVENFCNSSIPWNLSYCYLLEKILIQASFKSIQVGLPTSQ